jgi:hypothetical protein
MSTQPKRRSAEQPATFRHPRKIELVTHKAYEFEKHGDLTAYLEENFGGRREDGGIRGSVCRKGKYAGQAAEGARAAASGDPVFDAISASSGVVIEAERQKQLVAEQSARRGPHGIIGRPVLFDAPQIKFTGVVNGAERWAADDGSTVEYRIGNGRLTFHAWKKSFGYWSMGAEIEVSGTDTDFEFAHIVSKYFMSVTSPCMLVKEDQDSDRDDDYLDEYEWGINAQQPERVASLCRAQWHHARFADVVTAGSGCLNFENAEWPIGFPSEWNAIPTSVELNGSWTDGSSRSAVITRKHNALNVNMSAYNRPAAHGLVSNFATISVTFPDDKSYTGTLEAPRTIRWSNGSAWTKVINTVFDLNGSWTDGGGRRAFILETTNSITVDMSDYDRPAAHGAIVNSSTIKVNFPDDREYTATLELPNRIRWSNGSSWTKI